MGYLDARRSTKSSRQTLATILAAAIFSDRSSPLTIVCCGSNKSLIDWLPSIKHKAGCTFNFSTARFIANNVACKIFKRSISAVVAKPIFQSIARVQICFASCALRELDSFLLSLILAAISSGKAAAGSNTAAATTGPNNAPRPTSSTPAMAEVPEKSDNSSQLNALGDGTEQISAAACLVFTILRLTFFGGATAVSGGRAATTATAGCGSSYFPFISKIRKSWWFDYWLG